MNDRKRPAPEPLLPLHSKHPRTALVTANGETQSPASAAILATRCKRIIHEIKGLTKDTLLLFSGRVVSPDSRLPSPEETVPRESLSQSPPLSPGSTSQSTVEALVQPESSVLASPIINNAFASPTPLRPTNLAATTSYSAIPSTAQFSFTPLRKPWTSSSRSSEVSFPIISSPRHSPLIPPSSANNPYSSRGKRTKNTMGPPPDQPSKLESSQLSPALQKTLESLKATQRTRTYENRPHILMIQHKDKVKKGLEETKEELFKLKKKQGFKSNREDFESYLNFKFMLQSTSDDVKPRFTSPSMVDLRSEYKLDEERTRSRRHSDSISVRSVNFVWTNRILNLFSKESQWLQRQLEIAQQVFNTPRPKAWSPSLDDLKLRHRNKDDRIEQRLRPKRIPLPSSLLPEDEERVKALLSQPGVISKFAKEQVSNGDLARLKPGQWLNDEIINFYGAMILGRSDDSKENNKENGVVNGIPTSKKKKILNVHYFSSFFWQKLERDGYEKGRLAKWTKKIDLFSKDIALIPVNHGNAHWTAAAINFRQKRIESYDSMMLDRSMVFKLLRGYLDAEHRNKKRSPFDFTGWENYIMEDTPMQENGFDCGVFTCQFLESLSRGEESFNFTQSDMPFLRRKMIWEIGNSKLRTDP
ncbi:hypothetical protein D9757_006282 [Collybiopsis confluens]|uniref:Ubiquitin-like protease family profile domain-containing protein n=1 Tax=Collybiopsis confluens TaxID=2823264 RepID=A0A8H5HHB1_9AGAR|nr:hypothetical protein D9757_006282 [Collybiopsis confluens]